jgi:hypothetical protein
MNTNATDLPPPINHVFVDFENVHEIDLEVVGRKSVQFTLLLGPRQTRLDVNLVEKLLAHAQTVQLVRLTADGKNALDFALAYYMGRAVVADPTGFFHIVSKDTGFDPLVAHLRSKHIRAHRHPDFTTLTLAGTSKPKLPLPAALVDRALEHLRRSSTARPKRKKTLISHLLALTGNHATQAEVLDVIEDLRQAGHLAIDEKDAVTYRL